MIIFLTGFMGSGKSTVGRKLASKLNYNFIDLDNLIESMYDSKISAIFEEHGEDQFRQWEREALKSVIENDNTVISTGGGTPCHFDNIKLMKDNGICIYLKMDAASLCSRLISSKANRPLIKGKSDEELKAYISYELSEREKFYIESQITFNGKDVKIDSIINKLLA